MPRKIRQLIRDLKRAGFINRGDKGIHRNYEHPKGIRVTISGNLGDDAKPYQEKEVKRGMRRLKMTQSAKYIKIVEWSEEDHCFIGYCPGIIGPCCHGDDEVEVYRALCQIVDEWLEIAHQENQNLPAPTIGRNVAEMLTA